MYLPQISKALELVVGAPVATPVPALALSPPLPHEGLRPKVHAPLLNTACQANDFDFPHNSAKEALSHLLGEETEGRRGKGASPRSHRI